MSRTLTASRISLVALLLCQESLVLLCAAVPTGTRCPPVKGREAETCVCQTDMGVIDLTPIASTDGTPRLRDEDKFYIQAHLIMYNFVDSLVYEMALTTSIPTIPAQLTPQPYAPMFTYVTYSNYNILGKWMFNLLAFIAYSGFLIITINYYYYYINEQLQL
jgi:hypothetical protein